MRSGSGCIPATTYGTDTVSNNVTEILAVAHMITAIPDRWSGDLHTDSQITLNRVKFPKRSAWNGIHPELRAWVETNLHRLGELRWHLLAGHPTVEDLKVGYKVKANGVRWPVSKFNVWCDTACKAAGAAHTKRYFEAKAITDDAAMFKTVMPLSVDFDSVTVVR